MHNFDFELARTSGPMRPSPQDFRVSSRALQWLEQAFNERNTVKMKRCPTCNRVESDDTLGFCRADGTALNSDSGSVSADTATVEFNSAPVASEVATSIL
jgi:hypothetical protein